MTFISGQIPLHPETMTLVSDAFDEQAPGSLSICGLLEAAGGRLSDCVKLTIYLTDLNNSPR